LSSGGDIMKILDIGFYEAQLKMTQPATIKTDLPEGLIYNFNKKSGYYFLLKRDFLKPFNNEPFYKIAGKLISDYKTSLDLGYITIGVHWQGDFINFQNTLEKKIINKVTISKDFAKHESAFTYKTRDFKRRLLDNGTCLTTMKVPNYLCRHYYPADFESYQIRPLKNLLGDSQGDLKALLMQVLINMCDYPDLAA